MLCESYCRYKFVEGIGMILLVNYIHAHVQLIFMLSLKNT